MNQSGVGPLYRTLCLAYTRGAAKFMCSGFVAGEKGVGGCARGDSTGMRGRVHKIRPTRVGWWVGGAWGGKGGVGCVSVVVKKRQRTKGLFCPARNGQV